MVLFFRRMRAYEICISCVGSVLSKKNGYDGEDGEGGAERGGRTVSGEGVDCQWTGL